MMSEIEEIDAGFDMGDLDVETISSKRYRFYVYGCILDDSNYQKLIITLFKASKKDRIDFIINCDGGCMYITNTIIHAFRSSGIRTKAIVTGKCYSAASMLTLACDEVEFGPFGEMMIHTAVVPNPEDTPRSSVRKANFDLKTVEKYLDLIYHGFLTKKEIEKVKEYKELWFDSEEVNKRLVKWRKKRKDITK